MPLMSLLLYVYITVSFNAKVTVDCSKSQNDTVGTEVMTRSVEFKLFNRLRYQIRGSTKQNKMLGSDDMVIWSSETKDQYVE